LKTGTAAGLRDRELEGVSEAGDRDTAAAPGDALPLPVGVRRPAELPELRRTAAGVSLPVAPVSDAQGVGFADLGVLLKMSSADDDLGIFSVSVTTRTITRKIFYTCYTFYREPIIPSVGDIQV